MEAVLDCTISGNTTSRTGGGIFSQGDGLVVDGCTISGNTGASGGGIFVTGSDVKIRNSTISGNHTPANSYVNGGGICCCGSRIEVAGNTISDNDCAFEGGGLRLDWLSYVTVSGNIFSGNASGDHGGGIAMHFSTNVLIVNNLFVGNHTDGASGWGGGAIHALDSGPKIVNNTFVNNYVGTGTWPNITAAEYGGAIHVRGTPETILLNNVFYDNRAYYGCSVGCSQSGNCTVSYCDAYPGTQAQNYFSESGSTLTLGSGLLGTDPAFCGGSAPSQYWLATGSPCRGSGQNHSANSSVPTADMDGRTRPGGDSETDMGAYENDNRSCP